MQVLTEAMKKHSCPEKLSYIASLAMRVIRETYFSFIIWNILDKHRAQHGRLPTKHSLSFNLRQVMHALLILYFSAQANMQIHVIVLHL